MNLNVCIVEDSKVDAKIIKCILEEYFEDRHFNYSIKTYDTGVEFFADYEENYISPTTLFIKIVLPNSNGLDICKKLRQKGFAGDIVFVTDNPEFAVDAFTVDARGYILKPCEPRHVFDTLDRICSFATLQAITIKMRGQLIRIPLFSIMYVESNGANCTFHCRTNVVYTTHDKLDNIEEQINNHKFIRCHKSYLVNMNAIQSIVGSEIILGDETAIPIRRQDVKLVKETYEHFVRNDL